MNKSTAQDPARDWHPDWCLRGEDCTTDRALADRHHQAIREEFPTTDGEDFAISTLWEVFGTPGDEYPLEVGVELQLTNTVCKGMHALASLSPNTMRDLADFLFTQADRLDAWHEQHRAAFAAGGEAL